VALLDRVTAADVRSEYEHTLLNGDTVRHISQEVFGVGQKIMPAALETAKSFKSVLVTGSPAEWLKAGDHRRWQMDPLEGPIVD
jgi:hypothetical protein